MDQGACTLLQDCSFAPTRTRAAHAVHHGRVAAIWKQLGAGIDP